MIQIAKPYFSEEQRRAILGGVERILASGRVSVAAVTKTSFASIER